MVGPRRKALFGTAAFAVLATSVFANPAVWTVLARKGLTRTDSMGVTLTVDGLNYDTGLSDRFAKASDH